MTDDRIVAVSPQHSVRLAREYADLLERPQANDYVVRTIARREVNGMPLMSAEIVVAGRETRERHPLAVTYPLHFRKTYSPARMHGDTAKEFENHTLASRIIGLPPPIGFCSQVFPELSRAWPPVRTSLPLRRRARREQPAPRGDQSSSETFFPTSIVATGKLAAGNYEVNATALAESALCWLGTTSAMGAQQYNIASATGSTVAQTAILKVKKGQRDPRVLRRNRTNQRRPGWRCPAPQVSPR